MTSELDLHAYIFAGNALNYLLNGIHIDPLAQLGANHEALVELRGIVEPFTPANILISVAKLPQPQRELLHRCCRWCLENLGKDFDPLMGLSQDQASEVLQAF